MISFKRTDNIVVVQVKHGVLFNDEHFTLQIASSHAYQAELLNRQLKDQLENKLEAIRKEAYEQGSKDAKAKRAKKTWFSRWW